VLEKKKKRRVWNRYILSQLFIVSSGVCVLLATQHESDKPRGVFICGMSESATIINSCLLDVAEAYCRELLSKGGACILCS